MKKLDINVEVEFDETKELVSQLKKQYNALKDFEALQIAIEIIKNAKIEKLDRTLHNAFGNNNHLNSPNYLEAIAICLGMTPDGVQKPNG